ncbi:MAG: dihydropteroate synthase [Candidatus Hinthialibacter antarcticus]|nr:dihydropteroate synthase [Candidatus Hinthialibacter antarcticus]
MNSPSVISGVPQTIGQWHCRDNLLAWGRRTLIMGVVNVTPDSFSDGGQFFNPTKAIRQAERLLEQGADIIDIGGESSRPGADPVLVDEELRRVLPSIEELAGRQGAVVSIDTVKYEVAARALDEGAAIINDISGLQHDPRLAELAAQSQAGLVIMHMRGTPRDMQTMTDYENITNEVRAFFETQIAVAQEKGVLLNQIAVDPGIGFSKTAQQNLTLIQRAPEWIIPGCPVLAGPSRKSFIGAITETDAADRDWGTAGAVAACVMRGAHIIRVHNVDAMRDVVDVVDAIRNGPTPTTK